MIVGTTVILEYQSLPAYLLLLIVLAVTIPLTISGVRKPRKINP